MMMKKMMILGVPLLVNFRVMDFSATRMNLLTVLLNVVMERL